MQHQCEQKDAEEQVQHRCEHKGEQEEHDDLGDEEDACHSDSEVVPPATLVGDPEGPDPSDDQRQGDQTGPEVVGRQEAQDRDPGIQVREQDSPLKSLRLIGVEEPALFHCSIVADPVSLGSDHGRTGFCARGGAP